MIVDAHCHAWRYWPYRPAVPDPESRGRVEQLLFEMEQCGVERAVIVSAQIEHNPDNNVYVADGVRRFPDRLAQFADVDCSWSKTYHAPGAAARLEQTVRELGVPGFTHYVRGDDDGAWFLSEEGLAFFAVAASLRQIVSIALPPRLQPVLRQVAERFPETPFLCHHMAGARASEAPPTPTLEEICRSARSANICVKLSGFHYVGSVAWEYPYPECRQVVQRLYDAFGPDRLCWGSDYPVVRRAMTYRQSLEAVRTHCAFIPGADQERILGGTLQRLLSTRTVEG